MNILAPLAAGLALAPTAAKAIGELAHQLSFSHLLAPPTPAETTTPNDATSEDISAQVEKFRQQLRERLSLAGIDLSDPITLGATPWGEIEVRSPHFQAIEIEDMLNSDPELLRRFYETAARASAASVGPQQLETEASRSEFDQFELTIA